MSRPSTSRPYPFAAVSPQTNGNFHIEAVLTEADAVFLRAVLGRSSAGMCTRLHTALIGAGVPVRRLSPRTLTIQPIYEA